MDDSMADSDAAVSSPALPRAQSSMTLTEVAASAAARAFFYPSVLWNIARNRLQNDWAWWNQITECVILGALPFQSMLEEFRDKGVKAVVTLNEDFEVFITAQQYEELGFSHLHIPTVDFLFSPPLADLHRGADFIHEHAQRGECTYVHCKAGRGRSTTLVLCYLIKHCHMLPEDAHEFVRSRRPQVCLAPGQWAAVCDFHTSCLPKELVNQQAACPLPEEVNAGADLSAAATGPPGQCAGHADSLIPPLMEPQGEPGNPEQPAEAAEQSDTCRSSTASPARTDAAATRPGGLPYTLATGCCSQPLNGSIVDHFIPQEARCLPSTDSMVHRPLASKRRLGEADICPNEPELSATEAGSPVTGELPLAGRCKRVSCVPACADRQGPAEGQEGPRGKVNGGASPGSSSPSWLSSDTCHQLESLPGDCITADRSVQACEAACKDADMQFEDCEAERACGLQPTMAATGHQCLDNYCWQALHSDGSLESLHSLHTSTSF